MKAIEQFDSISLDEIDSVKLMNRKDTKFILKQDQLSAILEKVRNSYNVLEVNKIQANKYETLYFDTDDFKFYTLHHNGKLNRYKVRFRRYVDSNRLYLEVKFKSNKGRTIKDRIRRSNIKDKFEGRSKEHVENITKLDAGSLSPKLWIYYTRYTLVSKDLKERVTVDVDLSFKSADKTKTLDELVICEVKQDQMSLKSEFVQQMRKAKIQPIGFSKYCIGCSLIYDQLKSNRFKPRLLSLKKITYGNTA